MTLIVKCSLQYLSNLKDIKYWHQRLRLELGRMLSPRSSGPPQFTYTVLDPPLWSLLSQLRVTRISLQNQAWVERSPGRLRYYFSSPTPDSILYHDFISKWFHLPMYTRLCRRLSHGWLSHSLYFLSIPVILPVWHCPHNHFWDLTKRFAHYPIHFLFVSMIFFVLLFCFFSTIIWQVHIFSLFATFALQSYHLRSLSWNRERNGHCSSLYPIKRSFQYITFEFRDAWRPYKQW